MRVNIKAPASVAYEVRLNAMAYGLALDDFASTALHLAEVFMPAIAKGTVSGAAETQEEEEPEEPPQVKRPDFLWDFCSSVLPTLRLRQEFYRASALCEDTVLRLRAARLGIEAFNRESLSSLTKRRPIINPAKVVGEGEQFVTVDQAARLKKAGARVGPFHRAPAGLELVDLNTPASNEAAQRGMTLTNTDIVRWLPTLKHYGFITVESKTDDINETATKELILGGFARLMGLLLEGVCFLLLINPHLEGTNLRSDLLVVRHRAQRIGSAWEEAILRLEVTIHQLNAHSELLAERLMILAAHAAPMEPIFGLADAVPVVVGAREEQGAHRETVTDADLAAWRNHGDED